MAREIGISSVTLFPVLNETDIDITYGPAIPVKWAVSLESTLNYSESAYYADNVQEFSSKLLTNIDLTLEMSSNISPEIDAQITGKYFINGTAITSANTLPKPFAVAFEVKMDDGNLRRFVYYKTIFARENISNETVSDSVTAQTYTYTGKCSALLKNNSFMSMMDRKVIDNMTPGSPEKDAAELAWTNFFQTPQGTDFI